MKQKLLRQLKKRKQKGVALIVTLLVLLIIVLLSLSLLVQSDTEYRIAINEQDATDAFHYAEAGLNWAKRIILDFADSSSDFTDLLNGPDNGNAADDYLLELMTLDLSLTDPVQLNSSNETTTSLVVTRNFGDGNKTYEAFRWGVDTDGDSIWDGPRALIYVRIDDNYDESSSNDPLVDTDQNISATSVSEYPIFVDENGVESHGTRTISRRHLVAKFGDLNLQSAIVIDKNLLVNGNPNICGDCGSVHSNGNLSASGSPNVCQNFTASGNYNKGGAWVGQHGGGGEPEIPIPVINPYRNEMIPVPSDFTGMAFGCTEPKLFALVANDDMGLVFKAYWDPNARPNPESGGPIGGWMWRLIDDLKDDNTILDDCGRVVSGSIGGVALTPDPGFGAGVNDNKTDEFYGFKLSDKFTFFQNCTGDETLSDTSPMSENDFNTVNYYNWTDSPPATITTSHRLLPGGYANDNIRDFSHQKFEEGKARWDKSGDLIHSPLYNAVIWVWGAVKVSGNPGIQLCSSANSQPCTSGSAPPDNRWRVSFVAVSTIDISGNPKYSPATTAFPFLLASGRDIALGGNASTGDSRCGTGDNEEVCAVQVGNSALYAGIIAAHEQVKNNGNYSLDGFMIIEDAVDCTTLAERSSGTLDFSGNPEIHYDCVNPPNPFGGTVDIISWQEVP